ncbi:putative TATA element modulatory factor [Podospora australis]|uniref:TATA element modulatory factor n=1 Tax=Podospora australis TaxID=1536484 RepID=A0AAN7AI16_9PEZI|nr:putative TATA element modulatory factor [Podospora australis]
MAARWGSLLSQAVASVEARLDNVLSEEGDGNNTQSKETKPAAPASPVKQSPGPSRTASTTRTNDRLQERLARAMAAKKAGQAGQKPTSAQASPRQSLDMAARTSTDSQDRPSAVAKDAATETSSPRGSQDITRTSQEVLRPEISANESLANGKSDTPKPPDDANGATNSEEGKPSETVSAGHAPATETSVPSQEVVAQITTATAEQTSADEPAEEAGKPEDDAQLQHQEEIHGYVERIDALEAKLQFLAREATDSARKAALAAPAGSPEKKLAEKDQQIAQLMEEGKNLASTEQKHRAILKKLRVKVAEDEKALVALKTAKEKSDKELDNLRVRARRADELEKAQERLQKQFDQAQKELSTLRPEARSKDSTIAELKVKLQNATEQADALAAKANEQPREQDKRRIDDLEEQVAALKVEKTLVADRAKAQARDLQEKAERANERAKASELELKAEVQMMEAKLEAMRMRAEEASSGVAGDSQAKLLRQIEQLQTQYSIASENWQGIETNLLARIAGLEKERDEALQRESEMRRKAREAAVRAKRHEEELEEAKTKIPSIQEDVKSYQTQLDTLKNRAEKAEAALARARADFEKEKQSWEAEKEKHLLHQPIVERPRSWLEDFPGSSFLKPESRPASPQLSAPQRTFSTDFLGIQSLTSKARKSSAQATNSEAGDSRMFSSRRPSAQPPTRPTLASQPSQNSGIFSPLSVFSPTSEAPSAHPLDRLDREVRGGEDAFSNVERSASPHQVLQDMVSVSTVAAGPSVQLVERMSAAIRRLESEKVAAREELARISKQRDEARDEIVAMMRQVESNRAAAQKVSQLEAEVAEMKERYETTLELLGEKSELVEELRADVDDVKAMYRDLVERTIK